MKIFVSDLDQTLLDEDHQMPAETEVLVKELREKGYIFGVATGRPRVSAETTIPNMSELFDFAVYENGGEIHDFHTNEIHIDHLLPSELVKEIVHLGRKHGTNPSLTYDGLIFTDDGTRYASYGPGFIDRVRVGDVIAAVQEHHPKVIFSGGHEELQDLENMLNEVGEGRFRAFKSAEDLLEVMHPQINKLAGIQWFLDNHNLSMEHVMTFGDNNNDVEMLRGSGLGVAVSNATELAKEAADKVIGSNADNAVYHFIKEYVGLSDN